MRTRAAVGWLISIVDRNLPLHRYGASNCAVDAAEDDKQRVSAGLDDPATMFRDCWVYQIATESPQPFERSLVIQADETAVANHVGIHHGD